MQLLKIHYEPSKMVKAYSDIAEDVKKLKKYIITADKDRSCYAIHHSQVSEKPFDFFVVHPRYVVGEHPIFKDRVIINPKILNPVMTERPPFLQLFAEDNEANREIYHSMPAAVMSHRIDEGCMSFPHKRSKKVERYIQINAEYQNEKMEKINVFLVDVAAQIFQHEIQHGQGKNIYYEKPKITV